MLRKYRPHYFRQAAIPLDIQGDEALMQTSLEGLKKITILHPLVDAIGAVSAKPTVIVVESDRKIVAISWTQREIWPVKPS